MRVTDESSPVHLDPSLTDRYHGDYDQSLMTAGGSPISQWADDRNMVGARNEPDVFTEGVSSDTIFEDGFETGDTDEWDHQAPPGALRDDE